MRFLNLVNPDEVRYSSTTDGPTTYPSTFSFFSCARTCLSRDEPRTSIPSIRRIRRQTAPFYALNKGNFHFSEGWVKRETGRPEQKGQSPVEETNRMQKLQGGWPKFKRPATVRSLELASGCNNFCMNKIIGCTYFDISCSRVCAMYTTILKKKQSSEFIFLERSGERDKA